MATGQWWIIWYNTAASGGSKDTYKIIQGTQAQAQADAKTALSGTESGPYATQADAQTAAKAGKGSVQQNTNPLSGGTTTTGSTNWYDSIGNFFSALSQSSLWIRVAKVLVGGALVIVGVAHLTGVDNKMISGATRALPLLAA
jgi:hypothetical protein